MKNALAFAAAATLALIGVGWYLGWYTVKTTKNADGTHNVNIGVDDHKGKADLKKGVEKGEKIVDDIEEREKNRQSSGDTGTGSIPDTSKLNSITPPKVEIPRFELPRGSATQTGTRDTEPPTFELPTIIIQPPGR